VRSDEILKTRFTGRRLWNNYWWREDSSFN